MVGSGNVLKTCNVFLANCRSWTWCQVGCGFSLSLLVIAGCGGGGGEVFPVADADPAAIATAIVEQYDTDGDGELSPSELKKNDGLVMLTAGESMLIPAARLDSDGSGAVSLNELEKKFADCLQSRRQGFQCIIMYRGEPLKEATVTLEPEPFMGDLPVASGITDRNGNCSVATADGFEGAVPGIYRLRVTHPTVDITKRYNEDSELSVALDPTNPYAYEGVPTFTVR